MNTETRARGVHSSRPGGYTHNDAHAAYATIERLQDRGVTRVIAERAFGLGPCAPAEVMALLQDRLANAES